MRTRDNGSNILDSIISLLILISWVVGIVIAKGFWSVFFAICFPPYAIYLTVEHYLIMFNLI